MKRAEGRVCRLLSPRIESNMAEDFIILAVNYRLADVFWTPTSHRGTSSPGRERPVHFEPFSRLSSLRLSACLNYSRRVRQEQKHDRKFRAEWASS